MLGHFSIKPFIHPLEATVLLGLVLLLISWSSLTMDHVGSKTRLLGQISLKNCSPSGGHSFSSVFMTFYQIVCLHDSLFT